MTIHVPYQTVIKAAGAPALADEWNDISTAVARIEAAQTPVTCSVYSTVGQTFDPSGAGATQWDPARFYTTFNVVEKDTPGGMQNLASGVTHDNQKVTIVQSGLYLLYAMVSFSQGNISSNGTYRTMFIDKNATATSPLAGYQIPPVSGAPTVMTVAGVSYLNSGDFITLRLDHNATMTSGNHMSTTFIGGLTCKMSAARLSS